MATTYVFKKAKRLHNFWTQFGNSGPSVSCQRLSRFFFLSEKTETHQKTPSNQESATSKTSKEEEKVTEVGKEE